MNRPSLDDAAGMEGFNEDAVDSEDSWQKEHVDVLVNTDSEDGRTLWSMSCWNMTFDRMSLIALYAPADIGCLTRAALRRHAATLVVKGTATKKGTKKAFLDASAVQRAKEASNEFSKAYETLEQLSKDTIVLDGARKLAGDIGIRVYVVLLKRMLKMTSDLSSSQVDAEIQSTGFNFATNECTRLGWICSSIAPRDYAGLIIMDMMNMTVSNLRYNALARGHIYSYLVFWVTPFPLFRLSELKVHISDPNFRQTIRAMDWLRLVMVPTMIALIRRVIDKNPGEIGSSLSDRFAALRDEDKVVSLHLRVGDSILDMPSPETLDTKGVGKASKKGKQKKASKVGYGYGGKVQISPDFDFFRSRLITVDDYYDSFIGYLQEFKLPPFAADAERQIRPMIVNSDPDCFKEYGQGNLPAPPAPFWRASNAVVPSANRNVSVQNKSTAWTSIPPSMQYVYWKGIQSLQFLSAYGTSEYVTKPSIPDIARRIGKEIILSLTLGGRQQCKKGDEEIIPNIEFAKESLSKTAIDGDEIASQVHTDETDEQETSQFDEEEHSMEIDGNLF